MQYIMCNNNYTTQKYIDTHNLEKVMIIDNSRQNYSLVNYWTKGLVTYTLYRTVYMWLQPCKTVTPNLNRFLFKVLYLRKEYLQYNMLYSRAEYRKGLLQIYNYVEMVIYMYTCLAAQL